MMRKFTKNPEILVAVILFINLIFIFALWHVAKSRWNLSLPALGFTGRISEENITTRSRPLVTALQKYKTDTGKYPADLQQLIPTYLTSIPRTGLAKNRQFIYVTKETASKKDISWLSERYLRCFLGKEDFVLVVSLILGGNMVYRPSGDYRDIRGKNIGNGWAHTSID